MGAAFIAWQKCVHAFVHKVDLWNAVDGYCLGLHGDDNLDRYLVGCWCSKST